MAATHPTPIVRCDSPPPDMKPTPALGADLGLSRCLSTASSMSHGSATTDNSHLRESLGSDFSAASRQSSASFQSSRRSDISSASIPMLRSRQSTGSFDTINKSSSNRRRGYMRPQGTDFAASARSRESVLSLGSIAHLQYYFARTGLLDGKGGQLARKRQRKAHTLDLSALDTHSYLTPSLSGSDHDSSYASMGSSPDSVVPGFGGPLGYMVESPIDEHPPVPGDDEYYSDDYEEPDPHMLPPTASTYNFREKPLPKPPSIAELKADLTSALDSAAKALAEAQESRGPPDEATSESPASLKSSTNSKKGAPGWHEIQGLHILDVMTLAIRAAKVYYTAHEQPDRLDGIKSEKALRSELLSVMDVLKRMATRGFIGGMREDEFRTMDSWIAGLHEMLSTEETIEAAERAERSSWTWLPAGDWAGREYAREQAFIASMLRGSADPVDGIEPLPEWIPIDPTTPLEQQKLPTPFLASLSNGLRLVQLHNCAVRKSRRRFGAIPTFHTDTQKPYRAADNIRYWTKAAELRWEVLLKVDALGLQYNSGPQVWADFEDALLKWCQKVREEITAEIQN
ncbi:hypothetical protein GQ53DRAFT_824230 [Thozetella sp. PMI_491]|nr:hypothetical protein GQ53DRAFT_824230 [Thozetella sp. PMI_491]